MDDIEKGKIGKKDEKLVGWTHIRKPNKDVKEWHMTPAGRINSQYNFSNADSYTEKMDPITKILVFGFFLFFIGFSIFIFLTMFGIL